MSTAWMIRGIIQKLCIVQSAKDIFIIEDSKQFDGKYFVIEELDQDVLNSLIDFINENDVKNVLFGNYPLNSK